MNVPPTSESGTWSGTVLALFRRELDREFQEETNHDAAQALHRVIRALDRATNRARAERA